MAFSSLRGRPKKAPATLDIGTPELRLKHALRITAEPIDLLLEKKLITDEQHWCGLHLRWLYTLRYGAPSLTTHYIPPATPASPPKAEDPEWRSLREREYHTAVSLLRQEKRYECVMRLAVFNELPPILNHGLCQRAAREYAVAEALSKSHRALSEGLTLLANHWRRRPR